MKLTLPGIQSNKVLSLFFYILLLPQIFTYVSTAFSNANRQDIGEVIYKPQTHYSELLKIAQLDLDDPKYQQSRKR